jgi:hypothetical protein
MKNPYTILGVDPKAGDEEIRKAWLDKVRKFPPETAPEKFREIRQAYDAISTHTLRLRRYLFSTDCDIDDPLEALTAQLEQPANRRPPPFGELQAMINHCVKALYCERPSERKK